MTVVPENGHKEMETQPGMGRLPVEVRVGLKSSVVRRGVDLGDHLGHGWLASPGEGPESGCGGGNLAYEAPLPAANVFVPMLAVDLGR